MRMTAGVSKPDRHQNQYLPVGWVGVGGGDPVIDLLSLNGYVILTKFKMETVFLVLESIRKGDIMF